MSGAGSKQIFLHGISTTLTVKQQLLALAGVGRVRPNLRRWCVCGEGSDVSAKLPPHPGEGGSPNVTQLCMCITASTPGCPRGLEDQGQRPLPLASCKQFTVATEHA